jgi:hypothetical protein
MKKMKIVINECYGGFGLSLKAQEAYLKLIGKEAYFYASERVEKTERYKKIAYDGEVGLFALTLTKDFGETFDRLSNKDYREHNFYDFDLDRDDINLVKVVEELGEEANGNGSELKVVEVPDGVDWVLQEYDGLEHIAEVHQTWG